MKGLWLNVETLECQAHDDDSNDDIYAPWLGLLFSFN